MNQMSNKLQELSDNNELVVVDCAQQRVKIIHDNQQDDDDDDDDHEEHRIVLADDSHSSTLNDDEDDDDDDEQQVKQNLLLSPSLTSTGNSCPVRQFFSVDQLVDCGGGGADEDDLQDDEDDDGQRSSISVANYTTTPQHIAENNNANRTLAKTSTGSSSSSSKPMQQQSNGNNSNSEENVKHVCLFGVKIVALTINGKERLCLAQISNTLLKDFSYNEIHNRRVALGITCVQCTPIQLEMLRRAGAMPSSSRRCGMITMREAERLCRSFLAEEQPPELPDNFYFTVAHRVNYGCRGRFIPSRYISSRAKCIECFHCGEFYSPNKFIFHSHKQPGTTDCNPPDSPNINSWRKHINLDWSLEHSQEIKYAWEDVKSLFNGGTRRRATTTTSMTMLGNCSQSAATTANSHDDEDHEELVKSEPSDKLAAARVNCRGQRGGKNVAVNSARQRYIERGQNEEETLSCGRTTTAIKEEAHKTTPALLMSQSERRKLPMGWPAATSTISSQPTLSSAAGRQQQSNSIINSPRRHAETQKLTTHNLQQQQQPPSKRFLSTTNWHTSHRSGHFREPAARCATTQYHGTPTDQRTQGYGNSSSCADNLHRLDTSNHQQQQQQQHNNFITNKTTILETQHMPMGGEFAQPHVTTTNRSPPVTNLYNSPLIGYGTNSSSNQITREQQQQQQQPSIGPHASGAQSSNHFIYSQLYSHLMQSQMAQQQQQQQQLSPVEAQLALRHHIWSSLLANLRCNLSTTSTEPLNQQQQQPQHQTYNTSQRASDHHILANQLNNLNNNNDTHSPLQSPASHGTGASGGGPFNTLNMIPIIYNNNNNHQQQQQLNVINDVSLFSANNIGENKDICK